MLIPSGTRIHLATQPADLRKGIDGLSGLVRSRLVEDPLSGHLFIFLNRRATAVKLLWWDHGGCCLLYKRLERGRFRRPEVEPEQRQVRISPAELASLLEGFDLRVVAGQDLIHLVACLPAHPQAVLAPSEALDN